MVSAAEKIAGDAIAEIEHALPKALQGDRHNACLYFDAFTSLTEKMLEAVNQVRPNLIVLDAAHHRTLDGEAMQAPFSNWVGAMGPGKGVALALVSSLRQTLPGAEPLPAPARKRLPDWNLENRDVVRFYRLMTDCLERSELPLKRVGRVLDLNRTELAALFGVTRQAVERWEAQSVPAERAEKLSTINAIVDLLEAQLKPDRIAAAVRRSAPAYGDRSILEAISAGDEGLVLAELRDAFNWASAA
ncbi:MAG: helix-turn-helix domain-containing protein [Solirubrobacterales bacterium]